MSAEDELRELREEYREQLAAERITYETRLDLLYSNFMRRAEEIMIGRSHPYPEQRNALEQKIRDFKRWVRDGKPVPAPDGAMPMVPDELKQWVADVEARLGLGGKAEE